LLHMEFCSSTVPSLNSLILWIRRLQEIPFLLHSFSTHEARHPSVLMAVSLDPRPSGETLVSWLKRIQQQPQQRLRKERDHLEQFFYGHQSESESVEEWHERARALFKTAFPIVQPLESIFLRDYTILGYKNKGLTEYVWNYEPRTNYDALHIAKIKERAAYFVGSCPIDTETSDSEEEEEGDSNGPEHSYSTSSEDEDDASVMKKRTLPQKVTAKSPNINVEETPSDSSSSKRPRTNPQVPFEPSKKDCKAVAPIQEVPPRTIRSNHGTLNHPSGPCLYPPP